MSFMTLPIVHLLPLWFGAAVAEEPQERETPVADAEDSEDDRREALFATVWAVPPGSFISPR